MKKLNKEEVNVVIIKHSAVRWATQTNCSYDQVCDVLTNLGNHGATIYSIEYWLNDETKG